MDMPTNKTSNIFRRVCKIACYAMLLEEEFIPVNQEPYVSMSCSFDKAQ